MMSWRPWFACLAVGLLAACSEESPQPPTAPTPPVGPPVLTCPAPITTPAQGPSGSRVTYPPPTVSGGRAPVTTTCTPGSDALFGIGSSTVTCNAVDNAGATASCTFRVDVQTIPTLRLTSFMAFGDSVTAGEVTVPLTLDRVLQIVVPNSSYPTALHGRLRQRYLSQTLVMANAGRAGEMAVDSVARFQTAMTSTRPQVVLLLTGYNDLVNSSTVTAATRAVERMAQEARGRGARLFLGTLTPSIQGRSRSQSDALIRQFNTAIRSLAAGEGAVLVDLYQAALLNVDQWIGIDGLHPTEAGYVRIAEQFQAAIQTDLEVR